MGISQITILVLLGLNLLIGANMHGKPKTGNYDFGVTFLSAAIYLAILITGGFFG